MKYSGAIKNSSLNNWSLQRKLFVLIAIIVGIAINVQGYLYLTQQFSLKEEGERQLLAEASSLAQNLNIFMESRVNDIRTLSHLDLIKLAINIGGGQGGTDSFLANMVKQYGYYDNIMVLDTSGKVLASSSEKAVGKKLAASLLAVPGQAGEVSIAGPTRSPLGLKEVFKSPWYIYLVSPIVENNNVVGAVAGFLNWRAISGIISGASFGFREHEKDAFVIGPGGKIIIHKDPARVNKNLASWPSPKALSGVFELENGQGNKQVAGSFKIIKKSHVMRDDWAAVVMEPEAALTANLSRLPCRALSEMQPYSHCWFCSRIF